MFIDVYSVYIYIAQALRVALLRAPPNTFFEDTFMWSGEDTFRAAEFPSATELPREDVFRRHFTRSRIPPRHRITSRRRFSKTLFPQPNFSPPPNCPPKTLFEDTFPAAEFLPATELPTEDAFRRHFSRSRIYARHWIVPSEVKKNNTARATDQRYCTVLEGDDQQKKS